MGYKILSNGIYSPSLSFGKIHIQGLYLRLNNKLILNINELNLAALQEESSSEVDEDSIPSGDEILTWIKRFLFVLSYFERLDIENIVFSDNLKRSVHYDGEEYRLDMPNIKARFAVEDSRSITELHITELEILPLGLQAKGHLSYQGLKKTLELDIALSPKEQTKDPEQPTLYLQAITDFHKIDLEARTSKLYNLNSIKPFITRLKNQTLNDWLFKNIKYDVIKLDSLRFQSTLDKQFLAKIQKTLTLDLAIESPKIYLASHVQPIKAKSIKVDMRDEKLHFQLNEPTFTDIKLNGSYVEMSNLFTQPLDIKVAIASSNAHIDDELNALLQVYNVNLPIRSKDAMQLKLDIDIYSANKQAQVWLNGRISAQKATLSLGGNQLLLKPFQLIFKHNENSAYIQILNTKLDYASEIQGTLNAMWNLQDSTLRGEFLIDTFALSSSILSADVPPPHIPKDVDEMTRRIITAIYEDSQKGFSEEILKIDKKQLAKITLTGDLSGEEKHIKLADFDIDIRIGEQNSIAFNDIAKIYLYSPILRYFEIPNGALTLQSADFKTFTVNGEVYNLNYPLYDKNANKLQRYALEGVINDKGIFIGSKNKQFLFVKEGNIIKLILKGYNLRIDEVLSSSIPVLSQLTQENEKKESLTPAQRREQRAFIQAKQAYERTHKLSPHITYIEAENMDFYIKDYVIPSDFASVSIRDGEVRGDVTYGNGVANIDIAYSRAFLRLNNFSDSFLNRVWGRDIFDGGLFHFRGIYDDGALKGEINIQNTVYKDLAIVQNILALIDTIPALLTFRKPGFSASGYEVKKGKVNFIINDENLVLENIDLVGSSIDVEGGGLVDLTDNTLNIVLKASTLKTLADVISKIPLIDYVILGSDGKFTTGIVLSGTLDKPKSEVSVAEDILKSPFEMVGRILEPLDNLLGSLSDALEQSVESSSAQSTQTEQYLPTDEILELEDVKAELQAQEHLDSQNAENKDSTNTLLDSIESTNTGDNGEDSVNEPNLPQQEAE